MELLLLGTSGPFASNDRVCHVYDHVKGTFAVLSMYYCLLRLYHWAVQNVLQDIEIFRRLKELRDPECYRAPYK